MINLTFWPQMGLVFISAILVDIVWGFYIRRAGSGHATQAANYAVAIMAFGALNAISYIGNHWFLIPILLGNWIGTFSVVKWDHRKSGSPKVE